MVILRSHHCEDFANFKTLLYESVDACNSLDEIDCDSWKEYYSLCKPKLLAAFDRIDFSQPAQCEYITEGCGNSGPFPAFRRLDCGNELPSEQWNLYQDYAKGCLGEATSSRPTPAPVPAVVPTPRPVAPTPPYNPTPYVPPDDPVEPTDKKPYVPPEERGKKKKKERAPKEGKSHWFRNTIIFGLIAGAGYLFWKRRSEFNFYRYRRGGGTRSYGMADDGMLYSGLTMESSTTFQPPTLPPTPQAIGGDQYYS